MATGSTEERHALTFLWKIENFVFYERGIGGNGICSPSFTPTSVTKWSVHLFPRGQTGEDERFRIYLNLWNAAPCYPIDCEWSFIGGDGCSLVTGTVQSQEMYKYISLSMPNCPTHEEVFVSRKSAFLPNDTLTVRCRIWKSVGNFERSLCTSLCSRTEFAVDSFQWPIEAFSHLSRDQEETNTVNVCFASRKIPFNMYFYLNGSSLEEAVAEIEVSSSRIDSELFATLKVSVLDNEEKAVKSVKEKHLFEQSEENQSWVLPELAKRKDLLAKQSDCLRGDVLTLLCEFSAVVGISHFLKKTICGPSDSARHGCTYSDASSQTDVARKGSICSNASCKSSITLGEDLFSMYLDHTGSDFELRSGDVSFPVHKQVLMARSPVFRAMFCSDMRESSTHSLEVPDVDAHTLNRMLTFLYAGTMDPDLQWEGAARLYYAADKYQVQSLKQQCSFILQSGILVSNVGDILTLADRHQDQELTSCVQDFFLRNFNDIMLSEKWYKFLEQDPSLAGKTQKEVYQKKLQMTSQ